MSLIFCFLFDIFDFQTHEYASNTFRMKKFYLFFLFIVFGLLFSSCYTRELYYSFEPSHGGVTVGSSYYYLAQVREYRLPKGISRFPDGGMSKETRQVFGLFRTDSLANTTQLVYQMPDIYGWPVRYSTRIDKNDCFVVFGIANVSFPDSLNGIYLYNLKNNSFSRYSKSKALPSISEFNQIAYCVDNKLSVDDIDGTQLFSYILNSKPAYVDWNTDDEIYIYLSNPYSVKMLKLSTGKTTNTELEYAPNYAQEKNKTQILKVISSSTPNLKELINQ